MSIASSVVGMVTGNSSAKAQKSASNKATDAQTQAAQAAIDEQKRQFDAIQKLLEPYTQAGTQGLSAQQDLLGLNGQGSQQAAYDSIANSPAMNAYAQQGENAILQNAAATGGLRGGNTQGALAQFRPQLLNQLINQQYANLGGMTSIGQNAASNTGNAGMQTGQNIGSLLQQQGNANASNYLTQGQIKTNQNNNQANAIGGILGGAAGLLGFGGF